MELLHDFALYIQSLFRRPKMPVQARRKLTNEVMSFGLVVFVIVGIIGITALSIFLSLWYMLLLVVLAVVGPLWYGFGKYHARKYGLPRW